MFAMNSSQKDHYRYYDRILKDFSAIRLAPFDKDKWEIYFIRVSFRTNNFLAPNVSAILEIQ